jgi:hypothetical protein
MLGLTDAQRLLEIAALAEAHSKRRLEQAEDELDGGRIAPAAYAEAYECWLAAACALKRAQREAEAAHGGAA